MYTYMYIKICDCIHFSLLIGTSLYCYGLIADRYIFIEVI